jgi:hypothetical protein
MGRARADRYREALAQDPEQYLKDAAEWTARSLAEGAERKRREEAERQRLKAANPDMYELTYGQFGDDASHE